MAIVLTGDVVKNDRTSDNRPRSSGDLKIVTKNSTKNREKTPCIFATPILKQNGYVKDVRKEVVRNATAI